MAIYDDESVEQAAQVLGIHRDEVIRAITVASTYERILRSNKDKRKNERDARIKQQVREQQMQKHPEWCWCGAQHDPNSDEVIKSVSFEDSPIYRCSVCGGEYQLGYAWS